MATISDGNTLSVFKFRETGLVALCAEVAALVRDGTLDRWKIDLASARYVEDKEGLKVVFDYLPVEESL